MTFNPHIALTVARDRATELRVAAAAQRAADAPRPDAPPRPANPPQRAHKPALDAVPAEAQNR
jgi:hypothetical protein